MSRLLAFRSENPAPWKKSKCGSGKRVSLTKAEDYDDVPLHVTHQEELQALDRFLVKHPQFQHWRVLAQLHPYEWQVLNLCFARTFHLSGMPTVHLLERFYTSVSPYLSVPQLFHDLVKHASSAMGPQTADYGPMLLADVLLDLPFQSLTAIQAPIQQLVHHLSLGLPVRAYCHTTRSWLLIFAHKDDHELAYHIRCWLHQYQEGSNPYYCFHNIYGQLRALRIRPLHPHQPSLGVAISVYIKEHKKAKRIEHYDLLTLSQAAPYYTQPVLPSSASVTQDLTLTVRHTLGQYLVRDVAGVVEQYLGSEHFAGSLAYLSE